jgi:hypothetical protein
MKKFEFRSEAFYKMNSRWRKRAELILGSRYAANFYNIPIKLMRSKETGTEAEERIKRLSQKWQIGGEKERKTGSQ